MSTHDTSGREWARVDQVVAGSIIMTDGGSPCWRDDKEYEVFRNNVGELYIKCSHVEVDGLDIVTDDAGTPQIHESPSVSSEREHEHTIAEQIEGNHYIGLYFVR